MKKFISLFLFIWSTTATINAHNLWIDVEGSGTVGEVHTVKIFYGEYTYDYYETVNGNFRDVEDFSLFVIDPKGNKKKLSTTQGGDNFYNAVYTPGENGTYRFILISDQAEVVDWTAYDLGVLKTNFYAFAQQIIGSETVGSQEVNSSETPLSLYVPTIDVTTDSFNILAYFKGKPLEEQEVIITIADQWGKTIYTDEHGKATFKLPWDTQYVIEIIYTEHNPGSFKGVDYEAVRHTATFTLMAEK